MRRATRRTIRTWIVVIPALLAAGLMTGLAREGFAAELRVGATTISITPDRPVPLSGQMTTRIARNVETPVTATALALESRDGDQVIDQAILVSCELVAIREGIIEQVREHLADRLPDFDPMKLVLSATHTHTAPVMAEDRYELPDDDTIVSPTEYVAFLVDRIVEASTEAWESRQPAGVGWGLGHAVVAQNRRSVYADGRSVMYGRTNQDDFVGIEGYEDHGVEVLFFWDKDESLIATAINVACPAQEVESRSAVNADFWHSVRQQLRERHGENLAILGWIGAAGDQSPHLMIRKDAEERMRRLRGLDRLDEIARRIVHAWDEAYEGARQEIVTDLPLVHTVKTIELPVRLVTDEEVAEATREVESLSADPAQKRRMLWHQAVLDRYEQQQSGSVPPYEMELHVIRVGDVAIATNPFELFTEYGIRMKARSPSLQTFVIQLAGPGSYLPTAFAVQGGGYSAIVQSSKVGPKGGDELVERTVEAIKALWPED
ncbi:hypothetical protein [Tautonia marina]|uniref:hypothetical protein n=1 Tax=Tautonia marina TaxID=2653855 RepID=UPI001260BFAC|nr:hypothetical protein [Tautonia marina]